MIRNIERLLFIEARLILHKPVVRRDLTFTFHEGPATATRDLADYRRIAPNNMVFRMSPKKAWHEAREFCPVLFVATHAANVEQQASDYLGSLLQIVTACATYNKIDELCHETSEAVETAETA